MSPPSVGPKLVPTANTTAFTPSARPRSARGKASAMMARPGAKINAPPSPWKARATTSMSRELAAPHGAERGHERADGDEREHGPLVMPPEDFGLHPREVIVRRARHARVWCHRVCGYVGGGVATIRAG